MFFSQGCGNAKTPTEAARYIEGFAARKWPEKTQRTDSELVADLMRKISTERIPEDVPA